MYPPPIQIVSKSATDISNRTSMGGGKTPPSPRPNPIPEFPNFVLLVAH